MTYIFYDTETTGLDAGFDQILQFAALVTDEDLNIVEEVNLRCRLQTHVLPSPGALVITGIRPTDIDQAALSLYEMIREIRGLIERHSPVVMVGFNSLSYDESMLRQALYQTLNPVYLTNTGGNCRMDMLRVAHAVTQYAPDILVVPTTPEGRPTFRLGLLAAANGLVHDHAHDALSDTRATLELAKLIRSRAPAVWEAMRLMSSKATAADFIDQRDVFYFTNPAFGVPTILATTIAINPDNNSEAAAFDLAHDPAPFLDLGVEEIGKLLKASPRVIRLVKLNSQPILMPLDFAPIAGGLVDAEVARNRADQIARHPSFGKAVGQAVANRFPAREPPQYVEQRIYDGFPSRADACLMEQFHARPWSERADVVSRIVDDRIRELGERLIYLERPDVLADDLRERFDRWRQDRLTADQDVPWVTLRAARQELDQLQCNVTDPDSDLLYQIGAYLDQKSEEGGLTVEGIFPVLNPPTATLYVRMMTSQGDEKQAMSCTTGEDVKARGNLKSRLRKLADYAPIFDAPDFLFGETVMPSSDPSSVESFPFYRQSEAADSFVQECYAGGWVLTDFNWSEWKSTPEAMDLFLLPETIHKATSDQLAKVLTVVIRQERFCEGSLGNAFKRGVLSAVVGRAAFLADALEPSPGEMFYLDKNGKRSDAALHADMLGNDILPPELDYSNPETVAAWEAYEKANPTPKLDGEDF